MRTLTSHQKYYVLSIFLGTLIPLQQTMAWPSSKFPRLRIPERQDIDTELWRGPYSQDNVYLLQDTSQPTQKGFLFNQRDRFNSVPFINQEPTRRFPSIQSKMNDIAMDLTDDAEFRTEFRNVFDTIAKDPVDAANRDIVHDLNVDKKPTDGSGKLPEDKETNDISNSRGSSIFPTQVIKRRKIPCDLSRITLNMLIEYIQAGRVCGSRATPVRFGLGK